MKLGPHLKCHCWLWGDTSCIVWCLVKSPWWTLLGRGQYVRMNIALDHTRWDQRSTDQDLLNNIKKNIGLTLKSYEIYSKMLKYHDCKQHINGWKHHEWWLSLMAASSLCHFTYFAHNCLAHVCLNVNIGITSVKLCTDECCYNTVQYNMILHTSLEELRQNINQRLNSQTTPHTLP